MLGEAVWEGEMKRKGRRGLLGGAIKRGWEALFKWSELLL